MPTTSPLFTNTMSSSKDHKTLDSSDSSHPKSLSRRFSSLSIFHRSKKSQSKPPSLEELAESPHPTQPPASQVKRGSFTDYEHISPPLIIPEEANAKKDTSRVKRMFKKFFAKHGKDNTGVVVVDHGERDGKEPVEDERVLEEDITPDEDEDDFSFKPPESWAVMEPIRASVFSKQPAIFDPEKAVTLRISKPDTRSHSIQLCSTTPRPWTQPNSPPTLLYVQSILPPPKYVPCWPTGSFPPATLAGIGCTCRAMALRRMLKPEEHPCEMQVKMLATWDFVPRTICCNSARRTTSITSGLSTASCPRAQSRGRDSTRHHPRPKRESALVEATFRVGLQCSPVKTLPSSPWPSLSLQSPWSASISPGTRCLSSPRTSLRRCQDCASCT